MSAQSDFSPNSARTLILGGGITGLAAALRVSELSPDEPFRLWEACERLGGVLETVRQDGFLIERSADSLLCMEPWPLALAERVGYRERMIPTNSGNRRASILFRDTLHPVPDGFVLMAPRAIGPLLRTPLLSPLGKARMAGELLIEPRPASVTDESLTSFATRRFGREAFERLIQPLIGGIYTADPARLSLAATLPRFLEMERTFGSLSGAMFAERARAAWAGQANEHAGQSGARYHRFLAPQGGMSEWIAAIAAKLPAAAVHLRTRATSLRRENGSWLATGRCGDAQIQERFDRVIVTLPAPRAAELVQEASATLAGELRGIPYAGSSVVVLGYRRDQFARPPQGFGMVVPAIEGRDVLAVSYASTKFPGRAPADSILLRIFVGGALRPELNELDDAAIMAIAKREVAAIYGIRGEPTTALISRWNGAMPQYHLGHLERIARIEAATHALPGLALAGAAYRGVGIPQCIRDGQRAAEHVLTARPSRDQKWITDLTDRSDENGLNK